MKTQVNLFLKVMLATHLFLSPFALAQVGDKGGNGGGEDGIFKFIRDDISSWMQKNIQLNQLEIELGLQGITGVELYANFIQAINNVGEKVVFTKEEIKFGANFRICKNENKTITCNIDAWNASSGDTRYIIVLHEYLGVAGLETNVNTDYSRYPISSKIFAFVKTKGSFELGMDRNCLNITYQWSLHHVNRINMVSGFVGMGWGAGVIATVGTAASAVVGPLGLLVMIGAGVVVMEDKKYSFGRVGTWSIQFVAEMGGPDHLSDDEFKKVNRAYEYFENKVKRIAKNKKNKIISRSELIRVLNTGALSGRYCELDRPLTKSRLLGAVLKDLGI